MYYYYYYYYNNNNIINGNKQTNKEIDNINLLEYHFLQCTKRLFWRRPNMIN